MNAGANNRGQAAAMAAADGRRGRLAQLAFFLRFVRPTWRFGAGGLVCGLLAAGFGAVLPLSTKVIIDFVAQGQRPTRLLDWLQGRGWDALAERAELWLGSLNTVAAAIVLVTAAAAAARIGQEYLSFRFQQEITVNLQSALFEHVLRLPLPFLRRYQSGYLVSRVTDDVTMLQKLYAQRVEQLAVSVLYLGFGISVTCLLSVKLTLIAAALLPLYLVISHRFGEPVRSATGALMEQRARVSERIQESLAGIEIVKTATAERAVAQGVARRLRLLVQARLRSLVLSCATNNLVRGVQFASTLLIAWFGVREIQRGAMSIGDFVAFNSFVVYLAAPVRSLSLLHLGLQPAFAALDRLGELFAAPAEGLPARERPGGPPCDPSGPVTFEKVSFAYENGAEALRSIDLEVPAGATVALVGPSGAGKSTLVSLLLALYRPCRGTIRIGGRDLAALDPCALRRGIAFVPQEAFLFADTIRRNIRLGNPAASDEAIEEAARKARIHDEILALPNGYETVLGERGTGLSVGQRQRLSMARCFVRDAALLIFDEPSAALDAVSERRLKESLSDLLQGRTAFIIAHRFSAIDFADRIVVLDAGRIVATGTHPELMAAGGLYRELYAAQQSHQ